MKYQSGAGGPANHPGLVKLGPTRAAAICKRSATIIRGYRAKKGIVNVRGYNGKKSHMRCFPSLKIKSGKSRSTKKTKKPQKSKSASSSAIAAPRRSSRTRKSRKRLIEGQGRR